MRFLILAFTLMFMYAPQVFAIGMMDGAKVIKVRVDKSGKGMIEFDKPLYSSPPACASGYPTWLAFDSNTAGGKSILSIALTAQASGALVMARGSGTCDIYSVTESWDWGFIQK
ncbi:MAG TPA: hypothetical protein VL995_17005 [Cellvibrio sp.]|nr:hypothetical protein [Cellvibrio sp.]